MRCVHRNPTPRSLLIEIDRREEAARVADGGKPAPGKQTGTGSANRTKDAKALVREARNLLKKEQFAEAERLIALAGEIKPHGWGLFEDSPEKLQRDLNKIRGNRDKDKAAALMVQARKLLKEGRLDEAKELAFQARELHGPYSMLDSIKSESAQHLLIEIARIEQKGNKDLSPKKDLPTPGEDPVAKPAPKEQEVARRTQALRLMSEARTEQAKGNLVDARTRLIEANNLKASYDANEPTPASMMAELNAQCNQTLNKWCTEGMEQAGAVADPDRFPRALSTLDRAKQLCLIFGQDPQPIEQRIANVLQMQGQSPPPPRRYSELQKQGLSLLNQARVEVDIGNLSVARKLAEEAYDRKFDLKQEAEWMLRTIDVAEYQRAAEEMNINARSGIDAFRHKDYRKAAQILGSLDMKLLQPNVLGTVREILSSREMQPSALALEPVDPPRGVPFAADRDPAKESVKDPNAGRVTIGDLPQGKGLEAVRAMEKIQFGYWRDRSIAVQQSAIEQCKTNPALAISRLEDFLQELQAVSLDANDQAALMRPIEIRINQYKRIQAQRVFEDHQKEVASEKPYSNWSQKKEAERLAALQEVQKEVEKRVRDGGILQKQGKWYEALQEYKIANQLLPNEPAPIIGIKQAELQIRKLRWKKISDFNEEENFDGLLPQYYRDHVDMDRPVAPSSDPAVQARLANRHDISGGLPGVVKSPAERIIEAKLREPISFNFRDTELKEAILTLRSITGLSNIVPDMAALRREGIGLDQRVSLDIEGLQFKFALSQLLKPLHLTYIVREDVLQITTERGSDGNLIQKVYNITDLVVPIPDYPTSTFDDLHKAFARHVAGSMGLVTAQGSPTTPNLGLPPGTPVSGGYGGYNGSPATQVGGQAGSYPSSDRPSGPVLAEQLISMVQEMVAQGTWQYSGGPGTIRFWPLGNALIVNQSDRVHEEIANLLFNLRKMQEVQVAIEMRVVTLSDQFYDLVNMNFEVGNTSNYTQAPGKIWGMVPAGTSPDMNIPFRSVAKAFSAPNGVSLNTGSIAIGAGVTFLNEIQVHMFMEAARGDKRTQTLANPRIMAPNGSTANIVLKKDYFFSTSATPIQNGAQVMFMPQNNPFPVGITMQVTPIVSADRRSVRLHLVPNITNLVSDPQHVPAMPVEIPVSQIYEGRDGGAGRTSFVKMYYQQPVFETVSLSTTVNVPDGSTVLLGGLKTLAEVRTETGPPVLSQIPIFSRFFRNTSYTRDARSLMIMVTPRIVINEEEMNYPQPTQPQFTPTAMRH